MIEEKAILRKKLSASWKRVKRRHDKEGIIAQQLLFNPIFQSAKHILIYASIYPEVDTAIIRDMSWKLGKSVHFPYCDGDNLTLWRISSMAEMEPSGYMGIQQPSVLTRSKPNRIASLDDMDLLIIPGLGFDRFGGRIGRGKGYYDRLLAQRGSMMKPLFWGISFEETLLDKAIPCSGHDIAMDAILTESGILQTGIK